MELVLPMYIMLILIFPSKIWAKSANYTWQNMVNAWPGNDMPHFHIHNSLDRVYRMSHPQT